MVYLARKGKFLDPKMSPVSPVFYTEETVSIGLKNRLRVGTSIPNKEVSSFTQSWFPNKETDVR